MLFVTTFTTADFVIVLHSARKVNILELRISGNEFRGKDTLLTVLIEFTMSFTSYIIYRNSNTIYTY